MTFGLSRIKRTRDEIEDDYVRMETHVDSVVDNSISLRDTKQLKGVVFFESLSQHSWWKFAFMFLDGFLWESDKVVGSPFFGELLSSFIPKDGGFELENLFGKLVNIVSEVSSADDSNWAAFLNSVNRVISDNSCG